MNSIFTRIINREIPSSIIYEDELCIAILDISPRTSGHTLLIPKVEIANFWDLPTEIRTHLSIQAQEVSKILIEKLWCERIQLEIVGYDVAHVHLHLIPRYNREDFKLPEASDPVFTKEELLNRLLK